MEMRVSLIQIALCFCVTPLLFAAMPDNDAPDYKWQRRLRVIAAALDEASAALTKGDKTEALRMTEVAYFEIFENANRDEDMEVAIRMEFGRTRMYEIESQFRDLWRGLRAEADVPTTEFRRQIAALLNELRAIAIELDGGAVMPTEKKAEPAVAADIPRPDMTRALLEIALIGAGIVAVAAFLYWRLNHSKSTRRT
jgi:hypothetical protein